MNKLLLPLLIILSLPLVFQSTPTEIVKLKTFDALVKQQEPSGNFTILNITEENVAAEGGWPIPRKRLGEINLDILAAGALGVGWVISFPQPDRMGGDQYFASSLELGPTILATFESPNGIYPKTTGTIIKGDDIGGILTQGVVENISTLQDKSLEGIATAPVDIDNLVRRIPLLLRTPDGWVSAFGTEVLKVLTGSRSYIITTNDNGVQGIWNYAAGCNT